jgi:MFS family permease
MLTLSFTIIPTLGMLFLARIFGGLFTSATLPTSQAYVTDSSSGTNRAQAFGILGAAFGLGFTFGPAIGGLLGIFGFGVPALFATFLAIFNFIWAVKRLPESHTVEKRKSNATRLLLLKENVISTLTSNPNIIIIITMFSLLTLAFSSMESTLIWFGNVRFGMDQVLGGFVLLIVGIVAIITQGFLIRPLSRKYSEPLLGIAGLSILIVGFLGLTLVYSLFDMVIWVIPVALGASIGNPVLSSLLSKEAPSEKSGEVLGLNQGFSSLMRIFGPLLGTFLLQVNSSFPYYAGAIILLFCVVLGFILMAKIKGISKEQDAAIGL